VTTEVLKAKKQAVKALRLIPGDRSRFEVKLDGVLIYNNNGDSPDPAVVLQKLGIPVRSENAG
jgi:predicted Rdx family selenoprotein